MNQNNSSNSNSITDNKSRLSFGLELEFGNIDRTIDIPEYLGCWDGPKINGLYRSVEEDVYNPLTKARTSFNSLFGGEINTQPSNTVDGAWVHYLEIMKQFQSIDDSTGHGHIHVKVSDLTVKELINIVQYTKLYQKNIIQTTYFNKEAYETLQNKNKDKYYHYVVYDSGRPMNEEKLEMLLGFLKEYNKKHGDTLLREARSDINFFLSFKKLVSQLTEDRNVWTDEIEFNETHNRAAINIYNLLFSDTIELRCFHETVNPLYKYSAILFAQNFILESLKPEKEQRDIQDVLQEHNYKFALMRLENIYNIYTLNHESVKLQHNNLTCRDDIDTKLLSGTFNTELLTAIKQDLEVI